uniref:V-SNARE coiled-coil homology domain-containing protein n=1 Tax=Apteryx owenii TaxID=8824 RepID=A0A8B9PS99_APTOW
MRVNVDKVLERDQKLSELDDRADALQAGASQFETSAAKLKRKYWWKNLKVPPETPEIQTGASKINIDVPKIHTESPKSSLEPP